MTPTDPTDPQNWLMRARSNLLLAQKGQRKGVVFEDLCFNAQQAAEKALKAVCLHAGQDFPKIHSISRLLEILESSGISIPDEVKAANILTQYAVQTRYPGPIEEVTLEEYTHHHGSLCHRPEERFQRPRRFYAQSTRPKPTFEQHSSLIYGARQLSPRVLPRGEDRALLINLSIYRLIFAALL